MDIFSKRSKTQGERTCSCCRGCICPTQHEGQKPCLCHRHSTLCRSDQAVLGSPQLRESPHDPAAVVSLQQHGAGPGQTLPHRWPLCCVSTGRTVSKGVPAGTSPRDSSTQHTTLGILEECKQPWIEKHWARVGHKRYLFPVLLIEMAAFATVAALFLCSLTVPCPPPLLCFCPHSLLALHSFLPSFLSCFLSFKSLLHFSKYLNIPLLQAVSSFSQALTPS